MIQFDTDKYVKIEIADGLLEDLEEEGFTYLHCTYYASPRFTGGWWVNLHKTSYLVHGSETIQMLNAINIPIHPSKHYLRSLKDFLKFTIIFPSVPKDWKMFDFKEECSGGAGLSIRNISRNSSGVYDVVIK